MFTDIVTLALAILGIIFILLTFMFKLIVWHEENYRFILPLNACDKNIFDKIHNIRSFCEFLGIHKKCTIVLINYGAPDWFCKKIENCFSGDNFIKITSNTDSIFNESP